jgi:hypothetical protein
MYSFARADTMVICGVVGGFELRGFGLLKALGFLFFGTYAFPLGVYIDSGLPGSNDKNMFIISIMVERKRIRFANTAGKHLVHIREINIEGKGKKIVPAKRKYVPANLSQISKKHDDAVKRAEKNVTAIIVKIEGLKRQMNFEKNEENVIKEEMAKQTKKKSLFGKKPDIEHFKNKLEETNKEKKKIMQKMMNAKLELNMAKNKLAAQKTSRM